MDNPYNGCDKKAPMKTLLSGPEKRFIQKFTPCWPAWVETWQLTLLTIPWSLGVIGFGILAGRTDSLHWLWASAAMIFLQWFTDCFDGAIGRHKNTGLIKWGFYMDHFLDFVFMCAVFIGWAYLFDGLARQLLWFMSLGMGCLMVNAFLSFGATNQFKITYLKTGPTEMRLYFILINTALILFGTAWLRTALPYLFAAFWCGIAVVVYQTQRAIWKLDMEIKHRNAA